MNEEELFFVTEAIRHARTLNLGDCGRFVSGMIAGLGPDHPANGRLREVATHLMASDEQLDLILIGQMKLDTPARTARNRR